MNRRNGKYKCRKQKVIGEAQDREKDNEKRIQREIDSEKEKKKEIGLIGIKNGIEKEAAAQEVETENIGDLLLHQKNAKRGRIKRAGNLLTKVKVEIIITLTEICRNLTHIVFTAKTQSKAMTIDNNREIILIKMMIQLQLLCNKRQNQEVM